MTEQVSVFIDNKPGRLNAITEVLRDHRIDIRAMTIADHRDYGVAKLLVSDPRAAHRVLVEQGFAAALKPVLAVAIEDRPGGLHELLEILARHQINVLDAYGFVVVPGQRAIWCTEVADPAEAARLVGAAGLRVLDDREFYRL
ncbi:MAG: ACT domain-containing protein [Candidatus Competibacter sp.]|nr:ACT domain-containing protein [Candidatus Competibacter sp.]MDS4069629.1 ACT domain-containing protein [Candidatus Competibacter sp.]